ncbi:P-loop containing nucleoside triphosphate hydrolase protein [Mycena leptocephala]|nr:P-loop containing nucleoside triphosphate hydrolase protein [Mycena leptocephala]
MSLPHTLSAIADVRNALTRLSLVFRAPLGGGGVGEGAGWVWEEKEGREKEKQDENEEEHPPDEQPPFVLHDITLSIPRSNRSPPSSGAASWEMRSTDTGGKWAFGGSVAWIQNATLRDNMLFGQPFEADSSLDEDLTEMCVWTRSREIISGQKQCANIARALYYGMDVVILDDPLSAVDANVGKVFFGSAIQGLVTQGKTCDYIYTLDGGRIGEAGTYPELIARGGEFARLDRKFWGAKAKDAGGDGGAGENGDEDEVQTMLCPDLTEDPAIVAKRTELAQRMMVLEGV